MLGEAREVDVAGIALEPDRRDADLRLVEILTAEPQGMQLRLGGSLRSRLGDATAVAIERGARICAGVVLGDQWSLRRSATGLSTSGLGWLAECTVAPSTGPL